MFEKTELSDLTLKERPHQFPIWRAYEKDVQLEDNSFVSPCDSPSVLPEPPLLELAFEDSNDKLTGEEHELLKPEVADQVNSSQFPFFLGTKQEDSRVHGEWIASKAKFKQDKKELCEQSTVAKLEEIEISRTEKKLNEEENIIRKVISAESIVLCTGQDKADNSMGLPCPNMPGEESVVMDEHMKGIAAVTDGVSMLGGVRLFKMQCCSDEACEEMPTGACDVTCETSVGASLPNCVETCNKMGFISVKKGVKSEGRGTCDTNVSSAENGRGYLETIGVIHDVEHTCEEKRPAVSGNSFPGIEAKEKVCGLQSKKRERESTLVDGLLGSDLQESEGKVLNGWSGTSFETFGMISPFLGSDVIMLESNTVAARGTLRDAGLEHLNKDNFYDEDSVAMDADDWIQPSMPVEEKTAQSASEQASVKLHQEFVETEELGNGEGDLSLMSGFLDGLVTLEDQGKLNNVEDTGKNQALEDGREELNRWPANSVSAATLTVQPAASSSPSQEADWWTNCTEQGLADWSNLEINRVPGLDTVCGERAKDCDEGNGGCSTAGTPQQVAALDNGPSEIGNYSVQECQEELGGSCLQEAAGTEKEACCRGDREGELKMEDDDSHMEEAYAVLAESCEPLVDMDDQRDFKVSPNLDDGGPFLGLGECYNARGSSNDDVKNCREVDGSHVEAILQDRHGVTWGGAVSMLTLDVCLELGEPSGVTQNSQENSNCESFERPESASWLNETAERAVRPMEWFDCNSAQGSFDHSENEAHWQTDRSGWIRADRSLRNCTTRVPTGCSPDTFIPITPTIFIPPFRSRGVLNSEDRSEEDNMCKACHSPSDSGTVPVSCRGPPSLWKTLNYSSKDAVYSEEDVGSHELVMEILEDEAEALGLAASPISPGFISSSEVGCWPTCERGVAARGSLRALDADDAFGSAAAAAAGGAGCRLQLSEKGRNKVVDLEQTGLLNNVFPGKNCERTGQLQKSRAVNEGDNTSEGFLSGALSFLRKGSRNVSRSNESRGSAARSPEAVEDSLTSKTPAETLLPTRRSQRLSVRRSSGKFRNFRREAGGTEIRRRPKDTNQEKKGRHVMSVRCATMNINSGVVNRSAGNSGVLVNRKLDADRGPDEIERRSERFTMLGVHGETTTDCHAIPSSCGAPAVQNLEIRCEEVLSSAEELDEHVRSLGSGEADATSIPRLTVPQSASSSEKVHMQLGSSNILKKVEATEIKQAGVLGSHLEKEMQGSVAGKPEEGAVLAPVLGPAAYTNQLVTGTTLSLKRVASSHTEAGHERRNGEVLAIQSTQSSLVQVPVTVVASSALMPHSGALSIPVHPYRTPEMVKEKSEARLIAHSSLIAQPGELKFSDGDGITSLLSEDPAASRSQEHGVIICSSEKYVTVMSQGSRELSEQVPMASSLEGLEMSMKPCGNDGSARTRGHVVRKPVDKKEGESYGDMIVAEGGDEKQVLRKGRGATSYFAPGWGGRKPAVKENRIVSFRGSDLDLSSVIMPNQVNSCVDPSPTKTSGDPSIGALRRSFVDEHCNCCIDESHRSQSQSDPNPEPEPETGNTLERQEPNVTDRGGDGGSYREREREGEEGDSNESKSTEGREYQEVRNWDSSSMQAINCSGEDMRPLNVLSATAEGDASGHPPPNLESKLTDSSDLPLPAVDLVPGPAVNTLELTVPSHIETPVGNGPEAMSSDGISEPVKAADKLSDIKPTKTEATFVASPVVENDKLEVQPIVSQRAVELPVVIRYMRRSLKPSISHDTQAKSTPVDKAGDKAGVERGKQLETWAIHEEVLASAEPSMPTMPSMPSMPSSSEGINTSSDSPSPLRTRAGLRERKKPHRFSVEENYGLTHASSKHEKSTQVVGGATQVPMGVKQGVNHVRVGKIKGCAPGKSHESFSVSPGSTGLTSDDGQQPTLDDDNMVFTLPFVNEFIQKEANRCRPVVAAGKESSGGASRNAVRLSERGSSSPSRPSSPGLPRPSKKQKLKHVKKSSSSERSVIEAKQGVVAKVVAKEMEESAGKGEDAVAKKHVGGRELRRRKV